MKMRVEFDVELPEELAAKVTPQQFKDWIAFIICGGLLDYRNPLDGEPLTGKVYSASINTWVVSKGLEED